MKINLDRLCKLAGVETSGGNVLKEASNRSMHDDAALSDEAAYRFGAGQLAEGELDEMEAEFTEESADMNEMDAEFTEESADMDEMVEVDEAMLVQEIRRAKKLMAEARQRKADTLENLQEADLRKMISEEIDSVFKDLNLTSGWVYGDRKPRNRTRGAVNTAFPGIGFRKHK